MTIVVTARRYASAVYAVVVCPSVCLSVCHTPILYQTAKHRITQTTPYDSPEILVFWYQKSRRNSHGMTPTKAPNRGAVGSNSDFRPISGYISETMQDRDIHCSYYGTLIGTCMCSIDWFYFKWPWMTLTTPNYLISTFFVAFHIFLVSGDTSILVDRLMVASASPRMANRPWKGRG